VVRTGSKNNTFRPATDGKDRFLQVGQRTVNIV